MMKKSHVIFVIITAYFSIIIIARRADDAATARSRRDASGWRALPVESRSQGIDERYFWGEH